ncbi:hypothetical protein ILYODFUR_036487 [Ilyodon furcidens]|uniref:Secreted protein n=1 Tax=Ilyodon furcidens TaxID=33524 RepID=A0ABV0T375_9TELE
MYLLKSMFLYKSAVTQPHSMMLPPSCLIVAALFLGLKASKHTSCYYGQMGQFLSLPTIKPFSRRHLLRKCRLLQISAELKGVNVSRGLFLGWYTSKTRIMM